MLVRRQATPLFYLQVFMIVLKASRLAKRGRYGDAQWIKSSLNTIKALESVGGRFEIDNVPSYRKFESPCVFIANHMSVLETFVLPCLIQPQCNITFVVKESLIDYPFFRHVMRSRNPIVVGRANPRQDLRTVLKEGQKLLKSNISVIIFPQTTRRVNFEPSSFNTLGVKLAARAKVPVIPIALKTDAWGLGRKIKDFGKIYPDKTVHICFGEPLQIQGSGKEEHRIVVDFIMAKLKDWQ
jgi:1-acyl-sn-glycerol-3-phosphate acyltransferase